MSQIALETEVVGSRFDKKTRTCFYTIQRNGKRWTAAIPIDDFAKHKKDRLKRRNHVAAALSVAMSRLPDPPIGTKNDPFKPSNWDEFGKLNSGSWYINPADGKLQQK